MSAQASITGNNCLEPPEPMPADLATIISAWAALPQAIKAGIVAMVKASASGQGE
jgi:hypothetical protein